MENKSKSLDVGFHYIKEMTQELKSQSVIRIPSLLHNGDQNEVSAQEYPTIFLFPGIDGNYGCIIK